MDERDNIAIFHLYRKDGTALFLHPFESLDKLVSILRKGEVVGKYGKEPRVESLTLFRNDLYRMIEDAVKSWVMEVKFIPRFIMSAAVFLLSYLFLSFVIRDPLPVVDEILIGAGLSIVTYYFLSRRDQRSNLALKTRVELRTAVDRIVFHEDPFMRDVENALQRNEAESREKILAQMLADADARFSIADAGDASQLLGYLEKRFSTKEYRKQERLLSKIQGKSRANSDVEVLSRWSESKKIDLSLFEIYRRVKKSYKQVK
ncbi:MAG: hypothetical protein CMN78_05385 [Spirochaetales bacterium]|nr:hypothetical protein [Spirochaetales bacterium]